MDEKLEVFEKMPVPKAVAKNAVPAMISMLVVLIYNMADTFFVGRTGDALQVAAVSLTTPVFLLFMGVGTLFGIGGTSVISRSLGAGKYEHAKKVSSFCFYGAIIAGFVFILVFSTCMPTILKLVGASEGTSNYVSSYLRVVSIGAPFTILSSAFSNIVRSEGKSKEAMVGMMLGTVVNIILDPIMILGLDMGVTGAALATVIGNMCGSMYYIIYFLRKKSMLSISIKDFTVRERVLTSVFAIGLPASLNSILMSLSNILLNNFLASYGDVALAAMGVAMKVNMIVIMLQIGLGQGIQPLVGYNYGAKNYDRFKEIIKFSTLCSIVMGIILTAICWMLSSQIVTAFIQSEEVLSYGISFVRSLMISGPIIGVLFVFTNVIQAMGAGTAALILCISRQGFVFMPLLLILNKVAGLSGIVYTQPLADYITVGIAIGLYLYEMKKSIARVENVENSKQFKTNVKVNESNV